METLLGVLFILSYLCMMYCLIRGYNSTIVLGAIAIFWAVLGGMNISGVLNDLIGGTLTNNAPAIITIIMGAWFAQVLLKTNVVSTIIRTTVEVGGDNPGIVMVIVMIVCDILFTSLYGIGPFIAVGTIVLPILLSLGIDKKIATVAYTTTIGVGSFLNVSQYQVLVGLVSGFSQPASFGYPWTPFAFYGFLTTMVVSAVGMYIVLRVSSRIKQVKKVRSWAVKPESSANNNQRASWYACITPLIPVLLVMLFKISVLTSFIIAIIYCLLVTKRKHKELRVFPSVIETFSEGMSNASGMVIFMVAAYSVAAGAKMVTPIITASFGQILPTTTLGLTVLLAAGIPFLLYRGPLAIGGAGIAVYSTIGAIGAIPSTFVWMMAMLSSAIHYSFDPASSPVVWSCSFTKTSNKDYLKTIFPIIWVGGALTVILLYIMHG